MTRGHWAEEEAESKPIKMRKREEEEDNEIVE